MKGPERQKEGKRCNNGNSKSRKKGSGRDQSTFLGKA